MAVLVEAISVIISRRAIDERFAGGWKAFLHQVPNGTLCHDDNLARVGFTHQKDADAYVGTLAAGGLVFRKDGMTVDFAIVEQLGGPTVPTPWLEFVKIVYFKPLLRVMACYVAGHKPDSISLPYGWKYEGSLSEQVELAKKLDS